MNFSRRNATKTIIATGAALAGLSSGIARSAASANPITLNVGFPAGGVPDLVARALGDSLRDVLQQPVIVNNRTGAGGQLALQSLLTSRADGSTYTLATPAALTIFPHLYDNLPYNVEKDLQPVSAVCTYFIGLAVNSDLRVNTLQEFVEWCKANPDRATYGIPGLGTSLQFVGELFAEATGVKLQAIPYKGGPALTQAVVSGEVASSFNLSNNFTALHQAGRLKLLAISSKERVASLPDVPTFIEQGLPGFTFPEWIGVMANANTPAEEVSRFHNAVQKVLRDPQFQQAIAQQQCLAAPMSREAFGDMIATSSERWKKHIVQTGFTLKE